MFVNVSWMLVVFDNKCQVPWSCTVLLLRIPVPSVNMLHRQAAYLDCHWAILWVVHIVFFFFFWMRTFFFFNRNGWCPSIRNIAFYASGKAVAPLTFSLSIFICRDHRGQRKIKSFSVMIVHIHMNLENNARSFSWQAKLWRELPTALFNYSSSDGFPWPCRCPTFSSFLSFSSVVPVIEWL